MKGIGIGNPRETVRPSAAVLAVAATSSMNTPDGYYAACNAADSTTVALQTGRGYDQSDNSYQWGIGGMWHFGYPTQTRYTHVMPPNSQSCSAGAGSDKNVGAHTASSHHPGRVNVLFCDGAVKAISNTINIRTWWALGTRRGGEVVSSDSY